MLPTQTVGSYTVPLFGAITPQMWDQTLRDTLAASKQAIEAIATSSQPATFANTFEALERLQEEQDRRANAFFVSKEPHATEEMSQLAEKWSPRFAVLATESFQNQALFDRCEAAAANPPPNGWSQAQERLIAHYRRQFQGAGLGLPEADRLKLVEIEKRLAELGEAFGDACRKAAAAIVVLDSAATVGLSASEIEEGKEAAKTAGEPEGFGVVLQPDTVAALLKKMEDRTSRQKLFQACAARGTGERDDNTEKLVFEILELRQRRAELLGFAVSSRHLLDNTMAKHPDIAMGLVVETWEKLQPALRRDVDQLKVMAVADGLDELQPWDVPFYTEQYRRQTFSLDEDEVKAYLPLASVRQGAFDVASKVFGIDFQKVEGQWYHPDAQVFEVTDKASGESLGLLSIDDAIRATKTSGAWMDNLRPSSGLDGRQAPWVVNVCNFPSDRPGAPALLNMEEAITVFHELGHALHALLSTARYPSQAGTNVVQDFVELPSQILENWVREPESLKSFAKHWQTGQTIPDDLLVRMKQAEGFGQSFDLAQYLVSAYLDLAIHSHPPSKDMDLANFERSTLAQLDAPKGVTPRHRLFHFAHLFCGDDYAAGYYSYLWAEVLEADAFTRFRKEGLFNPQVGQQLRDLVFAPGDSADPAALFEQFMGRGPNPEALLIKRGLVEERRPGLKMK